MGFNKTNYDVMNTISLPNELNKPQEGCSVLISSYNTSEKYIRECLDSIKHQEGLFNMEMVWLMMVLLKKIRNN